ncbi:hypothetical protein EXIGLDRAFT_702101 [Exidia glandulosa HHB12029]|uniref:Uncharacterized protein n=1 Tax=Exidia glandulosa HHB12029 TaxID=1314781 RepID=A0A165CPV1_EXIGL|nr:hypothetical protein EXIGLDRAFT_702101 [Exidia glandulosa HHB12029]
MACTHGITAVEASLRIGIWQEQLYPHFTEIKLLQRAQQFTIWSTWLVQGEWLDSEFAAQLVEPQPRRSRATPGRPAPCVAWLMAVDTPPPSYSQSRADATTPRNQPNTAARLANLPPPDDPAWKDGMEEYLEKKASAASSRNAPQPTTPNQRAGTTSRFTVPADAPPGTPRTPGAFPASSTAVDKLPAIKALIKTAYGNKRVRHPAVGSGVALEVSVTVDGLGPGEADIIRKALSCPHSARALPLTPFELEEFIKLRKAHQQPLTYDQVAAIRAADAARFFQDGRDDAREARVHMYYLDNIDERRVVFRLATIDLVAGATLMDRQTDSLTIIASVRPETHATVLSGAQDLAVQFHVSRSITANGEVLDEYKEAVEAMKAVFVDKIAMRHVMRYGQRIANSGRVNWTNSTCIPLTPAAAARMEDNAAAAANTTTPTPSARPAPTSSARAPSAPMPSAPAHPFPRDENDMFSPQTHRPPSSECGACMDEPHDPQMSPAVIEAYERAVMQARDEIVPGLPVQLATQFPDHALRMAAFKALRGARGDPAAMFTAALKLGLCGRHALKLANAAAEDMYQGMGLLL